jgi:hypothetical protein
MTAPAKGTMKYVMKTGALPSPKPLITMTIVNSTVETGEIIRMKRIWQ